MVDPRQLAAGDHSVFVCGNDAGAKKAVTGLLESFGHTDIIDLGDLSNARATEMLLPVWTRLFTGAGHPDVPVQDRPLTSPAPALSRRPPIHPLRRDTETRTADSNNLVVGKTGRGLGSTRDARELGSPRP